MLQFSPSNTKQCIYMYSTVCMLHEQLRGVIIPHAIYHYLYSILSIILLHIAGNSLLSTSMRPTLLLLSWIMKVTIDASTRLCVCILSITITTTGRITSGAKALTLLRDGWRGRKGFVRSASENMLGFIVYTVMTWVIWIDDTAVYDYVEWLWLWLVEMQLSSVLSIAYMQHGMV